ncbi:hypothetical protein HY493_05905 [Candidatus Woesearchaeota archaeon]|nr:hypothetical protein [Candidatus Woesearchaeota archaeon]
MENGVLYFRVECLRATHYLAARSAEHARTFAGIMKSGDETLEEISEQHAAERAPHFKEFARRKDLCSDGTYSLGVVLKDHSPPHMQGSAPYFRH